jgi:hypothetical protein
VKAISAELVLFSELNMFNFIWDLQQQGQIHEAQADAAEAKRRVRSQADQVRDLEFSLHRMTLVSQALWELLRERYGLTEEELVAKIKEIDLRDGKLDGRLTPQRTTCPQCQHTINTQNARCIYCGTTVEKPHVFQ